LSRLDCARDGACAEPRIREQLSPEFVEVHALGLEVREQSRLAHAADLDRAQHQLCGLGFD
jgi:hypothetical protein